MILGGTDTARVERLRAIMAEYHRELKRIPHYHGPNDEGRINLIMQNRRVTLNRIDSALAEDWNPDQ